MNWIELAPSLMSAVASVFAAIAAFLSLRTNKQSIDLAKRSTLAAHHDSASRMYSKVLDNLCEATNQYSEYCIRSWTDWAREIEREDNYELGGNDPRPLRHVLSNGCEMLAKYESDNTSFYRRPGYSIHEVIRNGVENLNEVEYQKLLSKADGAYLDFETVFGPPSRTESISSSLAFRWICYQLVKRVSSEDWNDIWQKAWLDGGWLSNYKIEFLRVKPVLYEARDSLRSERDILANSVFPLESNFDLSKKYNEILKVLDNLIDGCDVSFLETYQDWKYKEELGQLVLISMSIACFATSQFDFIYEQR